MAKSYDHNIQVFDDGEIFIDKFTVNINRIRDGLRVEIFAHNDKSDLIHCTEIISKDNGFGVLNQNSYGEKV